MTKLPRVDGMKQLGTAIVIAGVIAALLGGLVFKDALGIPLGTTHHMEEELEHAGISPAGATCHDIYVHVHEPTWSCLIAGNSHAVMEPIINKVTDLNTMLLLSVIAALVHLLIGLLFGLRNEWGHGAKHVSAKFGYLILLLTFFPAVVALLRADMFAGFAGEAPHAALTFHIPFTVGQAYMVAGVGFVLGAVILGWAEGFGGVLEIPSMFSAIMSYLRLGAVAIAKGAMALAFNNLTLVAALTGGGVILVLGLIGFLVAQLALLVLGLLSGGIQALRLNFVEFFTKFYKGGGTPYKPFGRVRVHTAPAQAATAATLVTLNQP
jgi:vacuolar-type H+-ATPase subunit I/STV1